MTTKTVKSAKVQATVNFSELNPVQTVNNLPIEQASKLEIYRATQAKIKQLKEERRAAIVNELGVKIVNGKEVAPSKSYVNRRLTIDLLSIQDIRTTTENKRLLKALNDEIVQNPSQLYKLVKNCFSTSSDENTSDTTKQLISQRAKVVRELVGANTVPTFKEFVSVLPEKFTYTFNDALNALQKLNPVEVDKQAEKARKLAEKLERQNKATQAK